ncbi:EAL domain-containing protein [Pseudomonas mosselii]|uniref:EAL domain-containing protein n=1 Tax=Pseudomonas mosselii TaxID=78327 RepID=UPI0021DB283B|nr:EAL domain-containing protein [Pseudomonas mosselii]MCU9528093.1 EAL domain-containing protein [Pseudomonas mosselii]MCU9535201.1 EAL domain-containing protein [Pseudomonas mosselii]MCU9542977.1 EAL domain-containing protein [Pseudomonas mosselii]MCU9546937.1 EAL domain-containing protein [Pseudomonas mosselii]
MNFIRAISVFDTPRITTDSCATTPKHQHEILLADTQKEGCRSPLLRYPLFAWLQDMYQPSLSNAPAWSHEGPEPSSFSLAYQPVFSIVADTRAVVAFEALLRITNRGVTQGPAELVARAEADGSIVEIDRWVLNQVIVLLRSRPRLSVWINTSQLSIAHPTFIEDALQTLIFNQVIGRVSFEVTETADVDAQILTKRLEALRLQALTVMVDDVRDGYAKRSLISSDAVAGCKLSRESTRELMVCERTRAEVEHLVRLCRRLGKQVVLEGIETTDELALADHLGITLCQGYFLGVPASPSDLQHFSEMRP